MSYNINNIIAMHGLPHECFVLKVDGRAKSQHRRLVDALRAGRQQGSVSAARH